MASYSDLSTAAGMLDRAAKYLVARQDATLEDCKAAGTLLGLAFTLRPQLVK